MAFSPATLWYAPGVVQLYWFSASFLLHYRSLRSDLRNSWPEPGCYAAQVKVVKLKIKQGKVKGGVGSEHGHFRVKKVEITR